MHSYDTRKATDLPEVLFDGIESTWEFWCCFLLCVNIIETLTSRYPFELSKISKRSYMPRTIQNEKPTEIFLAHRFFAVVKCFLKHFTTASEVNSYQEHLKNHKPQEMITQYECNSLQC